MKRIDPATNRVVATVRVGRAPGSVTVAGGVVWVSLPEQGGLGRIDPASNRSTVVPVADCCDGELAAGERALWAANALDGTLVRVDPASNQVTGTTDLGPTPAMGIPNRVAAGYGSVLGRRGQRRLGAPPAAPLSPS